MHLLRPKARADEIVHLYRKTLETGEPYVAPEDQYARPEDGETEFYQWRISRIPLAEGRYGVVCYFLDITEQVRARHDAEAARAAAEQANSAKSDFLAAMSHELRTPLNAIAGYVQLLSMGVHGALTDEQRQVLRRVEMSERHLLSLITDVLNFAKIEARHVEYDIKTVPLTGAVANVGAMMAQQVTAKGLTLENRIANGAAVKGDPDKVQQILLNLLSNATKFTPSGGRIVIDSPTREGSPGRDAVPARVRHGVGHSARQAGCHLRAVRAGRSRAVATDRRHGPGPRDQPRPGAGHGRRPARAERRRQRLVVHAQHARRDVANYGVRGLTLSAGRGGSVCLTVAICFMTSCTARSHANKRAARAASSQAASLLGNRLGLRRDS